MILRDLTLYDAADGVACSAVALSPEDAARHAWNLTEEDLPLLTDAALLAVAKVRPLKMRSRPPAPFMPLIGARLATLKRRRPRFISH